MSNRKITKLVMIFIILTTILMIAVTAQEDLTSPEIEIDDATFLGGGNAYVIYNFNTNAWVSTSSVRGVPSYLQGKNYEQGIDAIISTNYQVDWDNQGREQYFYTKVQGNDFKDIAVSDPAYTYWKENPETHITTEGFKRTPPSFSPSIEVDYNDNKVVRFNHQAGVWECDEDLPKELQDLAGKTYEEGLDVIKKTGRTVWVGGTAYNTARQSGAFTRDTLNLVEKPEDAEYSVVLTLDLETGEQTGEPIYFKEEADELLWWSRTEGDEGEWIDAVESTIQESADRFGLGPYEILKPVAPQAPPTIAGTPEPAAPAPVAPPERVGPEITVKPIEENFQYESEKTYRTYVDTADPLKPKYIYLEEGTPTPEGWVKGTVTYTGKQLNKRETTDLKNIFEGGYVYNPVVPAAPAEIREPLAGATRGSQPATGERVDSIEDIDNKRKNLQTAIQENNAAAIANLLGDKHVGEDAKKAFENNPNLLNNYIKGLPANYPKIDDLKKIQTDNNQVALAEANGLGYDRKDDVFFDLTDTKIRGSTFKMEQGKAVVVPGDPPKTEQAKKTSSIQAFIDSNTEEKLTIDEATNTARDRFGNIVTPTKYLGPGKWEVEKTPPDTLLTKINNVDVNLQKTDYQTEDGLYVYQNPSTGKYYTQDSYDAAAIELDENPYKTTTIGQTTLRHYFEVEEGKPSDAITNTYVYNAAGTRLTEVPTNALDQVRELLSSNKGATPQATADGFRLVDPKTGQTVGDSSFDAAINEYTIRSNYVTDVWGKNRRPGKEVTTGTRSATTEEYTFAYYVQDTKTKKWRQVSKEEAKSKELLSLEERGDIVIESRDVHTNSFQWRQTVRDGKPLVTKKGQEIYRDATINYWQRNEKGEETYAIAEIYRDGRIFGYGYTDKETRLTFSLDKDDQMQVTTASSEAYTARLVANRVNIAVAKAKSDVAEEIIRIDSKREKDKQLTDKQKEAMITEAALEARDNAMIKAKEEANNKYKVAKIRAEEETAEVIRRRRAVKYEIFEKTLTEYQGLSYYSPHFLPDSVTAAYYEFADKYFNNVILGGIDYWTSAICQHYYDTESDDAFYYITPDGQVVQVAHIEAERSPEIEHPNGTVEYFYKITFFAKTTYHDNKFNVYVWEKGKEATKKYIFSDKIEIEGDPDTGDGDSYYGTGANAIVQYSKNYYTEVCIEFDDALPVGFSAGWGYEKEEDKMCNAVSESAYSHTNYVNSGETGGGVAPGEGVTMQQI